MLVLKARKCLRCGHVFISTEGGFIFKLVPLPVCPHCRSIFTIGVK